MAGKTLHEIIRLKRLRVICCTRLSGPCWETPCLDGLACPGGLDNPLAHQMVAALKTTLSLGPS